MFIIGDLVVDINWLPRDSKGNRIIGKVIALRKSSSRDPLERYYDIDFGKKYGTVICDEECLRRPEEQP